jgi:small-conductance mechanosensitive channel
LIDFEQLKIENQTLNEKIEERNEDLHKLKKKTTTMVQILTHTREKLVFVEKMKQELLKENKSLDEIIQGLRGEINMSKEHCEKLRLEIMDKKQDVEIVNSQQLVVDFKKRAQYIGKLEEELKEMLEREKEMKIVIEMYQRKQKKEALTR